MADCLFCRILRGELPASFVYRDERCACLLDIYPVSRGHALIIPIAHAQHLTELDPGLRAHLFELACRVRDAQCRLGLGPQGANVLVNDGTAANQHVPHAHVHVVPRAAGDRARVTAAFVARAVNVFGRSARRAELDALAAQLAAKLPGPSSNPVLRP